MKQELGKTIITGCRHFSSYKIVEKTCDPYNITEDVSGGARGADKLGERYARIHGIPIKKFSADWNKHGISAGRKRNVPMIEYADSLIAFWDNKSKNTEHIITIARTQGLTVIVIDVLDK